MLTQRINPTKNADVLSHVLRLLRFKANIFFHSSYCGEWGIDTSGTGRCTFHVVSTGNCWLHTPVLKHSVALAAGDLLIFPRDARHMICSDEQIPNPAIERVATDGHTENSTAMICGYFEFDTPRSNPVINALPECILIKHQQAQSAAPWLDQIIMLMTQEAAQRASGIEATLDKLSELLFIQSVRYLITTGQLNKGLLMALSDHRVNMALQAFHAKPADNWTVEELAQQANMSRSAFSALFMKTLETTPLQYITHWRMQIAYAELLESQRSIIDIAESVGYSSEAAFRKAFKNNLGITPGSVRKVAL